MKNVRALTLITFGIAALVTTTAVRATETESPEETYVESYHNKNHANAIPVSVETPFVDPELLEGDDLPLDVKVEFTVDAKGKPTHIVVKSDTDFAIAEPVINAIYDWHFTPAIRDGKPVAERLSLTVEFIEQDDTAPSTPASSKGKSLASHMTLRSLGETTIAES